MHKFIILSLILLTGCGDGRLDSWELQMGDDFCGDKGGVDYYIWREINSVVCLDGSRMHLNLKEKI